MTLSETLRPAALAGIAAAVSTSAAVAESDFYGLYPVNVAPDFVAVGYGQIPAYIGSDEYIDGVVPAARLTRGNRFVALNGNFVSANVLEHPNIRIGPVARLRFGRQRDNFDDPVVATLPEIDMTLELGGFTNWTSINPTDPRIRWQVGLDVTTDVLDEHGGTVTSLYARQFFGVGRFGVAGVAIAGSHGTGSYMDTFFGVPGGTALPEYTARGGLRDVRFQAGIIQPVSPRWAIGAGFQYTQLIGDAADSPIVSERGSVDQWLVGFGLTYILGSG